MKPVTLHERMQLVRKRHLYIPMELVYEAEKWQVSIDDTCIAALHRKIHTLKKAYDTALNQTLQDPS